MSKRQKPQPKITIEIIKKIYETQQTIFQEGSRHIVESYCRVEQLDNLTSKANESFQKEKEHFEMAKNLINYAKSYSSTKKKPNKETNPGITIINKKVLQTIKLKIPDLIKLTKFVYSGYTKSKGGQSNNSNLQDLFAFSVIPSYFNFFWSESSVERFSNYFMLVGSLATISQEEYDHLARVAFVTPSFLLYSLYAFQPIFTKLLNYNEKNATNFFKDVLLSNASTLTISKYNYMIPREVFIVLCCSRDPESTLFNSFLKIAFSSPIGMYIYNLLHFSQNPSKEVLGIIKKNMKNDLSCLKIILDKMMANNPYPEYIRNERKEVFTEVNPENVLLTNINKQIKYHSINDSDDESDSEEEGNNIDDSKQSGFQLQKLFNLHDQRYCPEVFQPFFLSSYDISLFSYFLNNDKSSEFIPPDRLEYFRVYNDEEKTEDNFYNRIEQTMQGGSSPYAPLLRHLLQFSDPLPIFQEVPPDVKTIKEFFETYLVERGDAQTYSQRKSNFDPIKFEIIGNNFIDFLKQVEFTRKNDITALSSFSSVDNKLTILDGNSIESRNNMHLILDSHKKDAIPFKAPHSSSDYFKNPKLFIEDFEKLESSFTDQFGKKILYSKLLSAEKIDLQTFTEFRMNKLRGKQDLRRFDQEINSTLANGKIISQYFSQIIKPKSDTDETKFDKAIYLQRFIDSFELNYFNTGYQGKSKNQEERILESNSLGSGVYPPNDYDESVNIGNMVIEAFVEKSFMRKIDVLSRALTKMKIIVTKNFPPDKSPLGEPEFEPTFCAAIMRINPPNFYSNYVFFHDMIGHLPIEDIFAGFSRSIQNYLDTIISVVFNDDQNKINSCLLYADDDF